MNHSHKERNMDKKEFKLGQIWETRAGRRVTIMHVDKRGGYFRTDGDMCCYGYSLETGEILSNHSESSEHDLITLVDDTPAPELSEADRKVSPDDMLKRVRVRIQQVNNPHADAVKVLQRAHEVACSEMVDNAARQEDLRNQAETLQCEAESLKARVASLDAAIAALK